MLRRFRQLTLVLTCPVLLLLFAQFPGFGNGLDAAAERPTEPAKVSRVVVHGGCVIKRSAQEQARSRLHDLVVPITRGFEARLEYYVAELRTRPLPGDRSESSLESRILIAEGEAEAFEAFSRWPEKHVPREGIEGFADACRLAFTLMERSRKPPRRIVDYSGYSEREMSLDQFKWDVLPAVFSRNFPSESDDDSWGSIQLQLKKRMHDELKAQK